MLLEVLTFRWTVCSSRGAAYPPCFQLVATVRMTPMLRRIWWGDHAMTEWNAADYERISGLQLAMAEEVLALLDLNGAHRILDIGCGNGKITAEIAGRVPHAPVIGVDPSHEMIEFASRHYDRASYPNLHFEIADARSLLYREEFDLV